MATDNKRALVIVESPGKVRSIAQYLGDGYVVEASVGHVRDLPKNAADVPAKYKGQDWATTGVDIDNDFEPLYVVQTAKRATIKKLKDALKTVDELYLATDEDREGEAIAWHLLQELKPKVPVKRMVFHEITPDAIRAAVAAPRDLDIDLVDAQETRRILDRLYGFKVSRVLWKKVKPKLSAGRVQSVATRLIVDRERERMAFVSADYADLTVTLDAGADADPSAFTARVSAAAGLKVAAGRDFDSVGKLTARKALHLDLAGAQALAEGLTGAGVRVDSVEAKPYTRRPYPPFRTTTLQQDAGRKLGFTAQRTMSVAQELYEGGHITYMRTDSITLSATAVQGARAAVKELYGASYLPDRPRTYASKVKNAQEAHEAIRPAGDSFTAPDKTGLRGDAFRLYDLIWKRTVASQMRDAEGQTVSIGMTATLKAAVDVTDATTGEIVGVGTAALTSSGRTLTFPGFLRAYVQGTDEGDSSDDATAQLPALTVGDALDVAGVEAEPHATRPPARYTEPSLVAKLEELEIGRPSTYASILRTITERDYVFKKGSALVPTWLAFAVTRLLEEHFPRQVDYQFTAEMEDVLDEIAKGSADRIQTLKDFYFGTEGEDGYQGLQTLVEELGDIDPRQIATFAPVHDNGSGIEVRVGKFRPFVEDADGNRANIDEDLPPDELTVEKARELLETPSGATKELGNDPVSGNPLVVKNGRYGPYVTEVLPEDAPKKQKPRTASLFKDMSLDTVTLEEALKLLTLPRVVGADAEGKEITAANGPYGPYLKKGTDYRSLTSEDELFTVTLEQAEAIYAQPKQRGRRAAAGPLKELGDDPNSGKPVVVKDGRFGPYVTDGEYNATLRKSDSVEEITLERAAELLAEKRAKGPAPKKTTRRTSTAAKATTTTAAKKPATRKPAARKPAARKPTSASTD